MRNTINIEFTIPLTGSYNRSNFSVKRNGSSQYVESAVVSGKNIILTLTNSFEWWDTITVETDVTLYSEGGQTIEGFTRSFRPPNHGTPDTRFSLLIDTTQPGSATNTIILPTYNFYGADYSCTVEWGDGTSNEYSGGAPAISHVYAEGGVKTIHITGVFPNLRFNNTGDKLKLLQILNWGCYGIGRATQHTAFRGCVQLTAIADDMAFINDINVAFQMFENCKFDALPEVVTLAALEDGRYMFSGCTNMEDAPNLNLASLLYGYAMLGGAQLNTIDYSNLLIRMDENNVSAGDTLTATYLYHNAAGGVAKTNLQARGWTINDKGLE